MEDESRLTEALREARERGDPWYRLGRILQERLAGQENRNRMFEVWAGAAAATGMKPVVLKRLVTLMDRLDRVASETGTPVDHLLSGSYGAVELALRLYDRNPTWGMEALAELRGRLVTIEDLQRRLTDLPPGDADPAAFARSAALVVRSRRIRECRSALELYAMSELGSLIEVVQREPLRHFHRTGFEGLDRGQVVAGFDLHLADRSVAPNDSPEGLARSLLLARSMPIFALVFAAGDEEAAAEAASASTLLGMEWVGVLKFDFEGPAVPIRSPEENPQITTQEGYAALKAAFAARHRGGGKHAKSE
ncbi:hypothetical protein XI07_13910 [Bradyrhizobium sp. CCBAU 11445]|uniref:hypothetical protein n=1 Tax=Bradyrhizobium sp. CCBAU 11445 TaxID=1630896 RepID=UPI0023052179|nr:hypothetical protein [Bradyrhizobium sp. CCBAU 11445]MDA9483100.1 hypothetical protein [Bradyrhizobium sp. CCBAU 11445]